MPQKKSKALFTMKDTGPAVGKGRIYCGFVGGQSIGSCVATTSTAARRRLLAEARKQLK